MVTSLGNRVSFTMNGVKYVVPSREILTLETFSPRLYFTRRLLGYIVYPRWFITRAFLSEVIEMLKRNNMYKHELKKAIKNLIADFDSLERKHLEDFDKEFVEVMAASLCNKGLKKVNEIRGSLGGAMMNNGVKNYVLYSYPYTLLNLAYDNMVTYDRCMEQVTKKYGVDFTDVFIPLKGEKIYYSILNVMKIFVRRMGEKIGHIDFEKTGCIQKLNSLNVTLLDEGNLKKAFDEAHEEVQDDAREELDAWMGIFSETKEGFAETLSEKYNVKKLKK